MSSKLNSRLVFIVFIIFGFFGFFNFASAQTSSITDSLNAEILSTVWYSTTTVSENDSISIYAGFQNHSDNNLSGTAGFYVDNSEINKIKFSSNSKSLIKLETPYIATAGNHTIQVKILELNKVQGDTLVPIPVNSLLAFESGRNNLSVKYQITKDLVIKEVNNVANTIVNNIDNSTEKLANYVESLKKPVPSKTQVLGASTHNPQTTTNNTTNSGFSFLNTSLDALAFLLRHWIWTFVSLVFIILFFIFKKG